MTEALDKAKAALAALGVPLARYDAPWTVRRLAQHEDALRALITEHRRLLAELDEAHAHFQVQEARIREARRVDDDVRAAAVRETAAYIERITRPGLVSLRQVLADMEAAAERMNQGMTARGSNRRAALTPDVVRCDYCGDDLPSVRSRDHIPTTPDLQRLGFAADKVVCPECVDRARLTPDGQEKNR